MSSTKLSRKWLYIFACIAIAALVTCIFALLHEEYIIAIGTGLVLGAQIINIVQWKKKQ